MVTITANLSMKEDAGGSDPYLTSGRFAITRRLLGCVFMVSLSVAADTSQKDDFRCFYPMDVIFVLDGSQSVTQANFEKVKKFTIDLIDRFTIGENNTRVGVIEYSTFLGKEIGLGTFNNADVLKLEINNIKMSNSGTGTDKALIRVKQMFDSSVRQQVPQFGVVITDGLSVSPPATKESARQLHDNGIIVFAVGIESDRTFQTELEYIATSPSLAFSVSNFDALPLNLSSILCSISMSKNKMTTTQRIVQPEMSTSNIGKDESDGYIDQGRYFGAHTSDCSKYIETVPAPNNNAIAHERTCPFGLFWDNQHLTCVNSSLTDCVTDPCRSASDGTSYSMSGTCSGYWICFGHHSFPACCGLGNSFVTGSGCVSDRSCSAQCPPVDNTLETVECNRWPVPGNLQLYIEKVNGMNMSRPCAPGSTFDQASCDCSTHYNQKQEAPIGPTSGTITSSPVCRLELYLPFNVSGENSNGMRDYSGRDLLFFFKNVQVTQEGMLFLGGVESCLNIWRFSNIQFRGVSVSLDFIAYSSEDAPSPLANYQVLFSNCFYKMCQASVTLVLDRYNHRIGAKIMTKSENKIWWHTAQYKTDTRNSISLSFSSNGTNILLDLNGIVYRANIQDTVMPRQTGLIIGAGGMFDNFKGLIDEIKVLQCD